MCDRGLWLDKGQPQLLGDAREVASAYQRFLRTDAFRGTRFFHPNWFVPRAEFVRMMVQAHALPLITPEKPSFSDVAPSLPFYTYIETAHARAWIKGFEGGPNFLPLFTISRADARLIVLNAVQSDIAAEIPAGSNGDQAFTYWAPELFGEDFPTEGDGLTRAEAVTVDCRQYASRTSCTRHSRALPIFRQIRRTLPKSKLPWRMV